MTGNPEQDPPTLDPADITAKFDHGVMRYILPEVELHLNNAPAFKQRLYEAFDTESLQEIVINMDNVSFIDSTNLGVLLGVAKRMRRVTDTPVRLEIAEKSDDTVYKVFAITGLNHIFNIHPPREE